MTGDMTDAEERVLAEMQRGRMATADSAPGSQLGPVLGPAALHSDGAVATAAQPPTVADLEAANAAIQAKLKARELIPAGAPMVPASDILAVAGGECGSHPDVSAYQEQVAGLAAQVKQLSASASSASTPAAALQVMRSLEALGISDSMIDAELARRSEMIQRGEKHPADKELFKVSADRPCLSV